MICYKIYNYTKYNTKKIESIEKVNNIDSEQIGSIKIKKLNLNQPLYKIDSEKNNIEENVTILRDSIMPDQKNSIVFLAAHSGTGKIAYFEELNQLTIGDIINLEYKNQKYEYKVNKIWEENKNGYIHINKENRNQLILTTCSPTKTNKQLVINSINKSTSINY